MLLNGAIAAAEALEAKRGTRAALGAFQTLASAEGVRGSDGAAGYARAVLGALRCAVALHDFEAVRSEAARWPMAKGEHQAALIALLGKRPLFCPKSGGSVPWACPGFKGHMRA